VFSSPVQAEDLMQVYQLASESDPAFYAALAAREGISEQVTQAKGNFLPSVNGEIDLNHNRYQSTYKHPTALSSIFGGTNRVYSYPSQIFVLSLVQPVYHRENFSILRQAKIRVGQSDFEYGAARQDLMVRVAQRYFEILAAADSLETAHAEKQAISRQLEQSKQRFSVGLIAMTDVHETQASYDLATAKEIIAENQLANAQEALREITGEEVKTLSPLSDKVPLVKPNPEDLEQWTEIAIEQNLALSIAQSQVEIAREQVEVQRSAQHPRFDLVSSFQNVDADGGNYGGSDSWNGMIGLRITVPLYQGGIVNSRIRQAESDYTRATELLEQQKRATILNTRNAYLGVLAGIAQVNAFKQALVSNRSALDATEAGYQVGTRTIVDVLNAQRLLYAAERDYSSARYNYVLNTLRLKQSAGQLSEADLEVVNVWLGTPQ